MSYIALYRKWRPLVFEDVVEQEHVVKTLRNSIASGRIAHAYLFCGTRGTGKTTMAKIFSRAINCLSPNNGDPCNQCEICKGILSQSIMDVVEIDAASNNSVDNIREIRDEVIYAPSHTRYKVYIIDEVHMLSQGAFNALLKTLEEPPPHVVFILATTEPHKLPATILSRCQRYDFKRISIDSIIIRLEEIAAAGGTVIEHEALRLIARLSEGAMRDAISILDQCMAPGIELSYEDVLNVVGIVNDIFMSQMIEAVSKKDVNTVMSLVDTLIMEGKDINQFVSDMVYYMRNLIVCKVTDKPSDVIEASKEELDTMKKLSENLLIEDLMLMIKELSHLESSLKWATHPRVLLEVTLLKICNDNFKADFNTLAERLSIVENKLLSGNFTVNAPVQKANENSLPEKKEAPKKAPPALKSKGSTVTGWDSVVNGLKNGGRMTLFTILSGTKALVMDDGHIGIVFGPGASFNKAMLMKAENRELVESKLSEVLGFTVRIKCVDSDEVEEVKGSKTNESDEFLKKAQEIVKKLDVPYEIIEE